jgi:hypothetical protein
MRIPLPVGLAVAAALVGASLAPVVARPVILHNGANQQISQPRFKGWRPTVLPIKLLQQDLRYERSWHPVLPDKKSKKPVKNWLMDDGGYIWGINGKKVVTYLTDCSGAEGGIVDHSGRLIVACTNTGTVNIYNAGNTTGPADVVLSEPGQFPAAAFEDTAGNIYATNLFSSTGNGSISWWLTNNQSSGATPSGNYIDPNLTEDFFGDVDKSGNVYVDGFNTNGVPEVDMIKKFLKKPKVTNLNITMSFPGGVYVVSPTGSNPLLSVLDQGSYGSGTDVLYQYNLPVSPSPTPITTSYPPQNLSLTCDPVAGGYSSDETQIAIGDAGCHALVTGTPATNKWKDTLNINFNIPIMGAFVPSDK